MPKAMYAAKASRANGFESRRMNVSAAADSVCGSPPRTVVMPRPANRRFMISFVHARTYSFESASMTARTWPACSATSSVPEARCARRERADATGGGSTTDVRARVADADAALPRSCAAGGGGSLCSTTCS